MNTLQTLKYFFRFVLSNRRKKYGNVVDGQEIFSSNFQDLAAINLFQHKKAGWYLEVGAQDPIKRNNTYTLELNHDWRGVSFEIDTEYVAFFNRTRKNPCVAGDATAINYAKVLASLQAPRVIDYLQIDIDPPSASLAVLQQMPFDEHQFSFITFEHDTYQFGPDIAEQQRRLLEARGYVLLAKDATQDGHALEDWWVSAEVAQTTLKHLALPIVGRECKDLARELATRSP